MKRKKVCILYTGGTIGMVETEAGFAPRKGYLGQVLRSMEELFQSSMPLWELIEFKELFDSSNISVPQWNYIAETIREYYEFYDGFVILHGTDTMAYTASALSFMLEGLDKTVVITGSQIPIGLIRTDARDNLVCAMLLAAEGRCREVCLFFGGKLMRGNRATKVSADELEAFSSPNLPPLATAAIDLRYNDLPAIPRRPGFFVTRLREDVPVAVLKIFPGIQFRLFEDIMTEKLKGLVIEAFGVGNIPQYDRELIPVIKKAVQNGTVVVVCTQCLRGSVTLGTYETSSALLAAGAVSGKDMMVEAAVTKLNYLFSKGYEPHEVKRLMEEDLAGELSR